MNIEEIIQKTISEMRIKRMEAPIDYKKIKIRKPKDYKNRLTIDLFPDEENNKGNMNK